MTQLLVRNTLDVQVRNRRLGVILFLAALLYIAAVIAFIITY
jgi:hypothetical protein